MTDRLKSIIQIRIALENINKYDMNRTANSLLKITKFQE